MSFRPGLSASQIAVVGAACRVPGAGSTDAFWELLTRGDCSVVDRPVGRWNVERFLRPGAPEPGFTYSFAGGYLDDPFAFDPAPFGLSPREARQMDPQQRLLLEIAWIALEDAGLAPADLATQTVGVYVGASAVDHQAHASIDPAIMESHYMSGNSLSILSNRISYVFDLRGPSFTLDSACSSSFVALAEAVAALEAGRIDTAIVGGVNLLLTPVPFIGFSQARMLSPTGRSRPFSQDADGYVRSEGAAAVVLRRLADARAAGDRVRGVVLGTAVNSDGRTTGISLPSLDGQKRLLGDLYGHLGLDPDALAFIEAHGTGTKVGDPIEATAIGDVLAKRRARPLPIGSVKSNVGHLEAASGLVGFLKTLLALEHRLLPPSLHCTRTNELIDFDAANLTVVRTALPLATDRGPLVAGICNYGFGGTNAHVVLGEGDAAAIVPEATEAEASDAPLLVVSAATREALSARLGQTATLLEAGAPIAAVAATLGHRRAILPVRFAVSTAAGDAVAATLRRFAAGGAEGDGAFGQAASEARPIAWVFSGNGGQYERMGAVAYARSAAFRREIDDLDRRFRPLAGWSIAAALETGLSAERLARTSICQPILYAIQSALAAVAKARGLRPAVVFGHSMGEVAAAEAAGILDRDDALKLIHFRSLRQEEVRGEGRMLVVAAAEAQLTDLIADFGSPRIEIAAINGPASATVSGPDADLTAFARRCRRARVATVALDIDYPFHSSALDRVEAEIVADLADLAPHAGDIPFLSTVTATMVEGAALTGDYWWTNLRRPVHFAAAVDRAIDLGIHDFHEIGPAPILTGAIRDCLRAREVDGRVFGTLSQKDQDLGDPVAGMVARMVAHGAGFDRTAMFGPRPRRALALPAYPFQDTDHLLSGTAEAMTALGTTWGATPLHPLLGARLADGSAEWRSLIDPVLVPWLGDHRVDGGIVVPAAALIETALAAARELLGTGPLEIGEFDISKALTLAPGEIREIATRWSDQTRTIEIWSRHRFAADGWLLHARGSLAVSRRARPAPLAGPTPETAVIDGAAAVYAEATRTGLDYGPAFRAVSEVTRDDDTVEARLDPTHLPQGVRPDDFVIEPMALDAAFHGLFVARPQRDGERRAHLPVRFRRVVAWEPGVPIRRTITHLVRETDRFKVVAISLLSAEGVVVASVEAAVLRAVHLFKTAIADRTFRSVPVAADRLVPTDRQSGADAETVPETPTAWLLVRAFCLSLARRLTASIGAEAVPETARPWFDALADLVAAHADAAAPALPSPEVLLATLMRRFPAANVEIRLCAEALEQAETSLSAGALSDLPAAMRQRLEADSLLAAPSVVALAVAVGDLSAARDTRLRVLAVAPFGAGLRRALLPLVQAGRLDLAVAALDPAVLDAQREAFEGESGIEFLDLAGAASPIAFDALVGHATAPMVDGEALARAVERLVPGAPVIVAVPGADATLDVLCGLWADGPGAAGHGPFPAAEDVLRRLERAGVADLGATPTADGLGRLLRGRAAPPTAAPTPQAIAIAVLGERDDPTRATDWDAAGTLVDDAGLAHWLAELAAEVTPTLLIPPQARAGDAVERLARRIESITRILSRADVAERGVRVFVITESARAGCGDGAVEAGVRGFVRVAINEYPTIDLRQIDLAPTGAPETVLRIAADPGAEREWFVEAEGPLVERVRRGLGESVAIDGERRSVLAVEPAAGLDGLVWRVGARRPPIGDEIEIAVAATGLNYRDLLVVLGILDDDLLGAGHTAASMGFECCGTVVRLGPEATRFRVGDRVMGFARDAFASHLTASDWQFFKVPEGVGSEAAATVPVVFATAWYALVDRARLKAGEDVLVHGAAGGVGLAATQIARRLGARVLGTASNPARRRIARSAGAELTFESRGERFAEAIEHDIGGVDVVLNSLAGPAMAASFRLVRPFGRFIELGKRDFLDNTPLPLRPFVRNVAYDGVDLDELIAHDRGAVTTMMREIGAAFSARELTPVPHQVYEAHEIATAFRSMQASEHVGKIVVRPARHAEIDRTAATYHAAPGVQLIVGGTAGFGFETARWLAARGATTLILASRRGRVEDGLEADLATLRAHGATVETVALDVTDAAAVAALVAQVVAEHGPIRGVIHAAVHLDDGLISGLTPERLRAVLATKVGGALALDAATADQPLDHFVVYSSATTVVGSPGQAAYVAANAFLEGFARTRRAAGRPALAIGWGAIADAGIIARDRALGERLRRTTGVVGIRSAEALAHLGRLLAAGAAIEPVQFYTNIAPSGAARKLALLASPAFAGLLSTHQEERMEVGSDLAALIAGKSRSEAVAGLAQVLRREVAHILRMPEAQIDPGRPLAELGLDSLMALELHMGIERLSGAQLPMVGTADRRIADIAATIYDQLTGAEQSSPEATVVERERAEILDLAATHAVGEVTLEQVDALRERVVANPGDRPA
ncbi:type I polyketide synthase [Siculibacillus lacustris]|nr:type I polyketide synthase [Siculibacillus lacustris]